MPCIAASFLEILFFDQFTLAFDKRIKFYVSKNC
jgi:hypothetical protein